MTAVSKNKFFSKEVVLGYLEHGPRSTGTRNTAGLCFSFLLAAFSLWQVSQFIALFKVCSCSEGHEDTYPYE